ncbi:MAG: sulfatase/phosphatase domain-containing protein, partial [Flavobacteriaceae bacterium]
EFEENYIYDNPYSKKYRLNNEKGYYQNILSDNNQLTEILDFIDINGMDKNTLFIYASDGGLRGKWSVDEVGLKIPLIIRWPKIIKPGSKNSDLINLVDILPTIIEATGNKIPKNLDGFSFLSSLKGISNKRKYTYGISTRQNVRNAKVFPSRSIRDDQFKYVVNFNSYEIYEQNLGIDSIKNEFIKIGAESFKNKPFEELYDLDNDPYEMSNLINDKSLTNVVEKLKIELNIWMIAQNDFLINNKMPLIKPTLHPLDKETEWTNVPDGLKNKIKLSTYMDSHY